MAKPADFYVGMVGFFAILLPGAVGTALLRPLLENAVIVALLSLPATASVQWAAFLIASYFLGHLIFLLGSYLDPIYDKLRKRWNPYDEGSAYQCATRIKAGMLDSTENRALNSFVWSQAILTTQWPAAATEVNGLEADSRFFRSLLVVLGLSAISFFVRSRWAEGIVALLLIVP
ncbi:MAG TPA: hypothetical protein VN648_08315, partial [Candidatus Methylomirabilis sp.]|nr:hypothetical protein [Candidatus Methylomirabilis sp.]